MNIAYIPLLFGIILNAAGQLLLKAGMDKIGYFAFSWNNVVPISWQVATNVYILLGLGCYAMSVVVWLIGLSRIDVSIAYPMLSLGYLVTAVIAYFVLHEDVSLLRVAGMLIILFGVYIVAKN